MEDLPEYSPYIQSEILYRDVISKLTNKSKLTFLFLQLNSGGSNEFISNQTWYKIKSIPLIEIKKHLLNEYYPYFFIYDIAHEALALNSSQTLIKSFNESCLKNYENIFIKEKSIKDTEITDNTVKIFFLKFHEKGHSKYKGNYRLEKSPQFILKNNLCTLDNDFNKIINILKGKMKYKEKERNKDITNEEDAEEEFDGNFEPSDVGESGFASEYYLFGNYLFERQLMKKKGLNEFTNVNLYIEENLNKFQSLVKEKLITYDKNQNKIPFYLNYCPDKHYNKYTPIPNLKLEKKLNRNVTYAELGISFNE